MKIEDLKKSFREKSVSPVTITKELLEKIKKDDLNAYVTIDVKGALDAAEAAEQSFEKGKASSLSGVPIAIKDNICTRGIKTTCASNILSNFIPTYDAHVVEKLKNAGAVILGKTNMDEFAMGSTTTTSNIGPTKNPWDKAKTPGGSSGGSATAVAGGLCTAALGSDTGGSIRQPASFCGITGLKPTYGSVSRYGLVAFASSLDQIGPMAKTAKEVAIVYDVIKGHDKQDSTSVDMAYAPTSLKGLDMKGIKIGVPKEFFGEGLNPEIEAAIRSGIETFKELGATIVDIDLPYICYGVAVYYIVATAEASSNLARYDGVRYGLRTGGAEDLINMYMETRATGFNAEVKRRIMLGTYALSAGYYDQYYKKASQVRTLIIRDFDEAFKKCDMIAGPTTPTPAFGLTEMLDDPLSIYLLDIYTIPANLSGLPGLSIPCGFTRNKLPIGLQIIAPAFKEDMLLRAGITFQDHTTFHEARP